MLVKQCPKLLLHHPPFLKQLSGSLNCRYHSNITAGLVSSPVFHHQVCSKLRPSSSCLQRWTDSKQGHGMYWIIVRSESSSTNTGSLDAATSSNSTVHSTLAGTDHSSPLTTSGSSSPTGIDLKTDSLQFQPGSEVHSPGSAFIPDPPPVPDELEFIKSLTGIVEEGVEPSFSSLGLIGWSPVGLALQGLEHLHVTFDLPWWAAITFATVLIRTLLFPLVIKSQRHTANLSIHMPKVQDLQEKMQEARLRGNVIDSARYGHELMSYMQQHNVNPLKSMTVAIVQAPIFLTFFISLRRIANFPVESLKEGGLSWFTDLTVMDPYYVLPFITCFTLWVTLEVGADGVKIQQGRQFNFMKYVLRGLPLIIFPVTMNFPAALLVYWLSSNAFSLVQVGILKIPAVRKKFKLPDPPKQTPTTSTGKLPEKSLIDGIKDSWANMKIAQEVEGRMQSDMHTFKKAGMGPLQKTYSYDPTKTAKSILAKKK